MTGLSDLEADRPLAYLHSVRFRLACYGDRLDGIRQRRLKARRGYSTRTTGIGTAGWHDCVDVTAPDGRTVEIDQDICELVLWLWAEGFVTAASCENAKDSGWAWLRFVSAEQARAFARLVEPARKPKARGLDVTFLHGLSLRPIDVMRAATTARAAGLWPLAEPPAGQPTHPTERQHIR